MGIRKYTRTVSKPAVVCSFPYEYFSVFGCIACSAEGNRNRCAAQRLSLSNHLCGGELTYNLEIQSNFRSNGSTKTALPINLTEEIF